MIQSGELDQRITVLAPATTRNSLGETVEGFAPLRPAAPKIWARAMEGLGKEFIAAGAVAAQRRVAFKIRFASDIAALAEQGRIGWGGHLYEIQSVTGTRRGGELWLHCQSIGKYP